MAISTANYSRSNRTRIGRNKLDWLIRPYFLGQIKIGMGSLFGANVIKEMKDKIARLTKPKDFSIRRILIHVNGVKDSVIESEFFAKIIDFGEFLEKESSPQ